MDRELGDDRRPERDDALHEVGPAGGQRLREHAAAALAHDHHALAVALGHVLEPRLEAPAGLLGAVEVGADARAVGAIAGAPQPARHRAEREVAGHEAGDQEDRAVLAGRHPEPVVDRAAPQRGGLEADARLSPQRAECGGLQA